VGRDADLLLIVQAHKLVRYNDWGKSPNKDQLRKKRKEALLLNPNHFSFLPFHLLEKHYLLSLQLPSFSDETI